MITCHLLYSFFFLLFHSSNAYHVGDGVDTKVSWNGAPWSDVRRNQAPLFGISSRSEFADASFRLSFAYGLWESPTLEPTDSQSRSLERIVVSFIYSSGTIRSVTTEPVYSNSKKMPDTDDNKRVWVYYEWVEEPTIQTASGQAVMFLLVFVASVLLLIASCAVDTKSHEGSSSNNEPKWD